MTTKAKRLAVLTSGGDAPGMNAAIRAVVRTGLDMGLAVFAIENGYQGLVDGGERIKSMTWQDVGGILHKGGTIIGSARCERFRLREGRLQAAYNLVIRGIDNLIIIGGDGSLTGANIFREEWADLLAELVSTKQIDQATANHHAYLTIVGLVGSIDNDMFGSDMTIGADTALHRITEAIDAISSTAASHQRTFVVEVMGRHCGYLALMATIAGAADWVFIPESPPDTDDWASKMCQVLKAGRTAGRRDTIVVVAEGAQDRHGNPITSFQVKQILEEQLGEDTRLTILGHVQRGGTPSAFDRNLGTWLGHAAVEEIVSATAQSEPMLIGLRGNRVTRWPLMYCVEQTHLVGAQIEAQNFEQAMDLRGGGFVEAFRTLRTLVQAVPHPPSTPQKSLRLAILHAGEPAPGMNTAVRTAVRLGLDQGHRLFGVQNGFSGLISGHLEEMKWMSVKGWGRSGGAELGTSNYIPNGTDFAAISRTIQAYQLDGLLMIGGWPGYQATYVLSQASDTLPALNIPIVCLPAAIDNNLPGTAFSIGADTALNNIVAAVDKIKQSAVAAHRCFIVEVMGQYCGYLALMSGLATGAERVYLPEEGITLNDLQTDLVRLVEGFMQGKRLGLLIRNEMANPFYTTDFLRSLFEEEGGDLFEVRQTILGYLQQGGNPSPFDRVQATQLAAKSMDYLIQAAKRTQPAWVMAGLQEGQVLFMSLADFPNLSDATYQRSRKPWWMELRAIAKRLAQTTLH